MTAFAIALEQAGLTQAGFRHAVERLSGRRLDRTTTSRWVRGVMSPSPEALALAALLGKLPPAWRDALTTRPRAAAP